MAILCCSGKKCKMKNNCQRYNQKERADKNLVSDSLYTVCNKKNDYLWIMLETSCTNKKYIDIYKKRKAKI